ncbi:hypothetical protein NMY22_g5011 [Coprinellus aureogranulatus]|nr:hypothetical protein NMY22_g5011 [Coprinellus aureogranulatus]
MDSRRPNHQRAASSSKSVLLQPLALPQSRSKRHVSAPSPPPTPHTTTRTSASRILGSMKRSLAPSASKPKQHEKRTPSPPSGVYSTPEERMAPTRSQPQHFVTRDDILAGSAPPTIEQIAMGLHLSRTPHLRPLSTSRPRGKSHLAPVALPPPPSRSSMKKPSHSGPPLPPPKNSDTLSSTSTRNWKAAFSGSSTTVTSVTTPSSSAHSLLSKFRLGRFLPGSRSSSVPSSSRLSTPVSSPRHSSSEFEVSQKKAVRFKGHVDD